MQFRHALLGTFLALLPLGAAAQDMPPSIEEMVTIRFQNYNLASAGAGRDGTLALIESFETANPLIRIEGVPTPSAEVMSRLQADVIAGQGPDIAQVIFSDLGYLVENFGVPSLEDIVPADELDAHLDGLYPRGVELGRLDGETYGLAYVFSTPILFYNADVFRAAGLDPDQPPRTWDEVSAAALTIAETTEHVGLMTGIFGPSAYDWLYQGFLLSNGARAMSEDRTQMTFASAEAAEALAMLREIAQADAMPNLQGLQGMEVMASGSAGMLLQTSAIQGALLRGAEGNFELRAAPMPTFGDQPATPTNSGSALVIMTDDPVRQRAAWEFMQHLTSDYGYTIITSQIGYVPLRMSAVESEEYLAPFLRENPLVQTNIDQLETLVPWEPLPGPNYRQILTIMMNASEQAVFGDSDDIAGILSEAQTRAQELVQ